MDSKTFFNITEYLHDVIAGTEFESHVYAVGGCVRDLELGNQIKDVDLVVDLENGGIRFARFLESNGFVHGSVVTYENFGTVMFRLDKFRDIELEAVQTRKECYRDHGSRNPETFFGTLEQDAGRRDFTINALYYSISTKQKLDITGRGMEDLDKKIIDTCGEPDVIFDDDPLRIMRAVRFAARLGFSISEATEQGIRKYAERLEIISQERITDEFNKILCDNATYGMTLLRKYGILDVIMPKLAQCDNCTYSTFICAMHAMDDTYNGTDEIMVKLSVFSFMTGIRGFKEIMRNMKYSNDMIDAVYFYASTLPDVYDVLVTGDIKKLRRLEHACGDKERYGTLIYIFNVLANSYGIRPETKDIWDSMIPEAYHPLLDYTLPIDGNDVMEIFSLKPSHAVKTRLDMVWDYVFEYPQSTRVDLLSYMYEMKNREIGCNS
jgi:poly(A) polymerase